MKRLSGIFALGLVILLLCARRESSPIVSLMYWGREVRDNRQGSFPADDVTALRQELEKAQ